jgi:ArsR family transcriptional regulator
MGHEQLAHAEIPPSMEVMLADMNEHELDRTAAAIKAMAHPLRMKLLCILGPSELSVHEISRHFQSTTQSNISQHLSQLLERDILANRKAGNHVFYSVRDPGILHIIQAIKSVYCDSAA